MIKRLINYAYNKFLEIKDNSINTEIQNILFKLEFYILKKELFRIRAILFLIFLALIHFLFSYFFFKEYIFTIINESLILGYFFFLIFYIIYELLNQFVILRYLKKRKIYPSFFRFLNATLEITAPTILLAFFAIGTHSSYALLYTPVIFYYILIVLSTIQLNYYISFYIGFVAFIEYFLLSYYFIKKFPFEEFSTTVSFQYFFNVSFSFFIIGTISSIVAYILKEYIKNALINYQEKNLIIKKFGQYVSSEIAEKIIKSSSENLIEKKFLTIMFLDIRNFTNFSEKHSSSEVVSLLNDFFEHTVDIINQHNGIVNKFLGDGLLAIFGLDTNEEYKSSLYALNASMEILRTIENLKQNNPFYKKNDWEFSIGIGINFGEVIVGDVGSKFRKEFTVIGDVVNTTSRIEQLNKKFNSKIIITSKVYENILKEGIPISFKDKKTVLVKGKQKQITIYIII